MVRDRTKLRSLYQCANAKFPTTGEGLLRCSEGHKFPLAASVKAAGRGAPLVLASCQKCGDYGEMGPPVPADERGWLKAEGSV